MKQALLLSIMLASSPLLAEDPEMLLQDARRQIAARKFDEAEQLLSQVIKAAPEMAVPYYLRGRVNFQRGKMAESVQDFDAYVKRQPAAASRQWERGIALYYAGNFKEGAAQFELYQTFHDNDVENSVWRFLCMVPTVGVEKSRAVMLPIKDDRRIPMMKVYEMFRGKATPEQVLANVTADDPQGDVLSGRLFYAHLYLGLYLEAVGEKREARKYIALAADKKLASHPRINGYMWDVARIHHELKGKK
jgi:lipoprotein NlpI